MECNISISVKSYAQLYRQSAHTDIQVGDVIKWGFYWTKSWKAKFVVHQNYFSKLKNIHIVHEKNFKNPGTTIFTLKNTLSPGTGPVPGFFWIFLHFFHGLYVYFLVLKKNLVDIHFQFCPIKSAFKQYLRHLLPGYRGAQRNGFSGLVNGWIFLIQKNFFIILLRDPTFIW